MSALALFWPALVASVLVGAAAPAIGTFIVQKRLSLIGDGIGHIAFAGVGLGLWLQVSPLGAAIVVAIAGAIGIESLRRRSPEEADFALALFFYGALATAVIVLSLGGNLDARVFGFLFGQVLTVSTTEIVMIAALATAILGTVALLYRGLVAAAIDEESAAVAGVPTRVLSMALIILTAITIGVGMQIVGILLVSALLVLPVGVARNLVRSFRSTLIAASVVGAFAAAVGLLVSIEGADTAPSGTMVLAVIGAFMISDIVRRVRDRKSRRAAHA